MKLQALHTIQSSASDIVPSGTFFELKDNQAANRLIAIGAAIEVAADTDSKDDKKKA